MSEAKELLELIHTQKSHVCGTDTVSFTGIGLEKLLRVLTAAVK